MTREDAINKLIRIRQPICKDTDAHEALGMAIDALAYQAELPEGLEEAAEEYIKKGKYLPEAFCVRPAFIAGAEWQKKQMMEKAVEGVVQDDGQFINFGDGRYIDLDPSLQLNPVWKLNDGQKVKLIIIPEDENVD